MELECLKSDAEEFATSHCFNGKMFWNYGMDTLHHRSSYGKLIMEWGKN